MVNMYENLMVGDLLVSRADSSLWIILKITKSVGAGYGRKKFNNNRFSYLLISHRGVKKWWKDIELKVKFKIPKQTT